MTKVIHLSEAQIRVAEHSLRCMLEHLQYEDEWTEDEKTKAEAAYESILAQFAKAQSITMN